jgi:hypothetical protein
VLVGERVRVGERDASVRHGDIMGVGMWRECSGWLEAIRVIGGVRRDDERGKGDERNEGEKGDLRR